MTQFNKTFRLIPGWLTFASLIFSFFSPLASAMNLNRANSDSSRRETNQTAPAPVSTGDSESLKKSINIQKNGFEENRGQFDKSVRFVSRRANQSIFLTAREAVFTMPLENSSKQSFALRMEFNRANKNSTFNGLDAVAGKTNYFRGNDASKWQSEISTFAKVEYEEIYQGVNLHWYNNADDELEYDFIVAPNADYRQIELKFNGAKKLEISGEGDLLIHTKAGILQQRKPFSYQTVDGAPQEVASRYELNGKNKVRFVVGNYDREKQLVIDPAIVKYGTFLGGSGLDYVKDVTLDSSGNIYVVGYTNSTNFPTTSGALDTTFSGDYEVFVSKFNPSGTALIYSTFVGGTSSFNAIETGNGIEVDAAGNVFVVGSTPSTDFPTVSGSYDLTKSGSQGEVDPFVFKLNPAGNALVFSTFLGTSAGGNGNDLVIDSNGNINVTGTTFGNLPVTVGAFDVTRSSLSAFYTKLNPSGSGLLYCTYLSGTVSSRGYKIATDSTNNIYVAGSTFDANFPVTTGAYDTTFNGGLTDAFVTKFNPNGGAVYSTYIGGNSSEGSSGNFGIAADANGNCYLASSTRSDNFPTTPGAISTSLMSSEDGFLIKLNASGNAAIFSTLLSKEQFVGRRASAIALDANGNIYVSGENGFVSKVSSEGSNLAGVFRMNNVGTVQAIKLNSQNEVYAVCDVSSVALPVTPDAFDPTPNGSADVGLVRLQFVNTAGNSDFDGDGRADTAVYRDGVWHLRKSTQGLYSAQFGLPTDTPVPADYDGDGKTDLAVWRAGDFAYFYILQSGSNTVRIEQFGKTGDDPTIIGDYDGDGKAEPAVYRNASATQQSYFYYRGSLNNSGGVTTQIQWGTQNDKPAAGDYNGDGKMDFAVFRPSEGFWYILDNASRNSKVERFGLASDKLVQADYDGDAITDLAVFRPSTGIWYIRQSASPFITNNIRYEHWGLATDTLVPADYDGDGKTDPAVYRNGAWYFRQSSDGSANLGTNFGLPTDKPVQSVFVH